MGTGIHGLVHPLPQVLSHEQGRDVMTRRVQATKATEKQL